MAVLTINNVDRAAAVDPNGAALVAAAGGGDSFDNTGVEYAIFNNASGAEITVTFVIQSQVDGKPVTNRTLAVPAGLSRIAGPFPTSVYNDGNNRCNFTYSGVTTFSVGVFKNATT
jgi:hypothetical protein